MWVVSSEFFVSGKCRGAAKREKERGRDLLFQERYLTQYHVTKVDPSCIMPCTFLRKMPAIHIPWKRSATSYNIVARLEDVFIHRWRFISINI